MDFAAKDDLHGIGYTPLTAPSYHRPAEKEEGRIAFGGRRGISGKVCDLSLIYLDNLKKALHMFHNGLLRNAFLV